MYPSIMSLVRVGVAVSVLVSVSMMAGLTSICGYPANCSPGECVQITNCDHRFIHTSDPCVWTQCSGYEWLSPGNQLVIQTTAGTCLCVQIEGILVGETCIFNPNGNEVGSYTVNCVAQVQWMACPN